MGSFCHTRHLDYLGTLYGRRVLLMLAFNQLHAKTHGRSCRFGKSASIDEIVQLVFARRWGDGMERLLRHNNLTGNVASALALLIKRVSQKLGFIEPCDILWLIFSTSVIISTSSRYLGEVAAPLSYILAIGGAAGCGWLWLFARSIFQVNKPIARWNLFTIAAIVTIEAYWDLIHVSAASSTYGEVHRVAGNAASFICIGALVLVFVEIFKGYSTALPRYERRFRQTFAVVLGLMIVIAVLWAMNVNENSFGARWAELALTTCALTAVIGTRLALSFRKRHPLAASRASNSPAAIDSELAKRICHALEQEHRFTTPNIKLADLAADLNEQDYKVTQCITGFLGYRNFNHLINSHRIKFAKEALVHPDHKARPILSIAFDCGFNSLGPFNRAFKQEVGMTPREFRSAIR